MAVTPVLDLEQQRDLQGNILCAYDFPQGAHVFCRIDDPAAARSWLGALAGQVTTAEPWPQDSKHPQTLNVALSYAGLEALGMAEKALESFPAEFRAGMASRAARLRDDEGDAADKWDEGLDDRSSHIVLSLHVLDPDEKVLDAAIAALTVPAGITVTATQKTAKLAEGREHFGFSDGLAQPAIAGPSGPWVGQGTPPKRRNPGVKRWKPLAPGEFILGYPDEDREIPKAPAPFAQNSSYMVIRKLEQHVDVWERQLLAWALGDERQAEVLGAKLVGRWKNGTPMVTSPQGPNPVLDTPLPPGAGRAEREERFDLLNSFRFGGDPDGRHCPVGSHIRRANPRDAMGSPDLARRHRMIRRGMPYGPPPADRMTPDDVERGLFFVCFQASIARQFELVQGDWLRDGDVFGLGANGDALMSPGDRSKTLVHGETSQLLAPHDRTITLKGGGYFIVPSISALRALSKG